MRKKLWSAFAVTALLLTGCGEAEKTTDPKPQAATTITIDNEGLITHYEQAPEKAISVNQHATEVMLALGLEDKMVGTAYLDNEIYKPLQHAYNKVPVLANEYPTKEQVIASEADFIYAGWPSAFEAKTIATRPDLTALGINTYIQSSSVKVDPTLEDVYTDIQQIAKIFRVDERADKLVAAINDDVQAITEELPAAKKPLKVLIYDSGEKEIFTATQNFMNTLVTLAGGENVFGDINDKWATVSKEEAVDRQPEVIVIMDYGATTAEEKIAFLKKDPALSQTPAVQQQRFVVLPLSAASEGVRVAEALTILAQGFYPEAF